MMFFKKNAPTKLLRLQFYVIEDNNNGFIMSAHGTPLYEKEGFGLPWIGTEEMLPKQIEFIKQAYLKTYGRELVSVSVQDYEVPYYYISSDFVEHLER